MSKDIRTILIEHFELSANPHKADEVLDEAIADIKTALEGEAEDYIKASESRKLDSESVPAVPMSAINKLLGDSK